MFRRFSVNFAIISIFIDFILVAASLFAANLLRPLLNELPFIQRISGRTEIPLFLYILFASSWIAILLLLSVYDGRRNIKLRNELASLTLGSALAAVSLAGTLYLSFREISRALYITFVIISYLSLLIWRLIFRLLFYRRNGETVPSRNVLIVGAGPVGNRLQRQVSLYSYLGLRFIGYLDDDRLKQDSNQEILGTLDNARKVIEEFLVQDVIIALPQRAYERVNHLVAELHDLPVKVWVIPDYFHLALHTATVEDFAGIPMLDLRAPALNEYQRMVKRAFDLIITIFALPITLPLMGIISLAIRIDEPGPIFFKQKRVGENGKVFDMYKFRTMVLNAEDLLPEVEQTDSQGRLIHKLLNDPRVTRVGWFLRRTSLDELPQLYNILKGEMSLVGPRPEQPFLVKEYQPWQHKRFAVPQGLTGWWQVNGRSDKPMHLHTEEDIYYVQNYSLLLDLQILLKTIKVVLSRKGAY